MRGPCAKKQVVCVIITKDWEEFRGENDCANPQPVCPRQPNEDYLKCRIVCRQSGHAEIMALKAAGDKAIGAQANVYGIDNVCKSCQKALFAAGVESITIWNPDYDESEVSDKAISAKEPSRSRSTDNALEPFAYKYQ